MTYAILTAHGYTTAGISAIFDLVKSIKENRIRRRAIRETEKALMKLSNAELADIGLCRGDIYAIARKGSVIDQCITNRNLKGWV